MAYTPTAWVNNSSPDINATNLNHMETGIDQAHDLAENHIADTVDAHDASAISFSPTGTIASTDVQAAIAEVASEAGGGGGAADASTTVKGISKTSVAPASSTNPIAVGDNDPRVTADQAAGTASIRTLGTGAVQAATGNHTHSSSGPPFTDSLALVQDNADTTKRMNIECTDIGTGQWRTLRMPDRDINLTNVPTAAFGYYTIPFSFKDTLTTATGTLRASVISTGTIVKVFAKVGTAPTGAAILVDLNLNGTTIWSTQSNRVTIAISGNSGTQTTFNTTAVTEDDYMTCDLDQIGSTVAGANLTVFVKIRYAL